MDFATAEDLDFAASPDGEYFQGVYVFTDCFAIWQLELTVYLVSL